MKLLKELYMTNGVSGKEGDISNIVERELDLMKIDYEIDAHGQIYRIVEDNPLLCAHMDQVQSDSPDIVIYDRGEIFGSNKKGKSIGLGADDKNGIWICLNLLRLYPDLSFIFSTEEEMGGNSGILLRELQPESRFALVFDRKGGSDIVATFNSYCEDDMIDDILDVSDEFEMGFKEAIGTFSDCDHLSKYIPCVNISCGYHNAHSHVEHTVLAELRNSLKLGELIISELGENYYGRPQINVFDTIDDLTSIGGKRETKSAYTGWYKGARSYYETKTSSNKTQKKQIAYESYDVGSWTTCYECGQEYHETDRDEGGLCPFCGAMEYISISRYEEPTVKG